MAFLIYKKQSAGTATIYERLKPLRLSGPDGPIAKYVHSLSAEAASDGWRMDVAELLAFAGVSCAAGQPALIMDMGGDKPDEVCLYEVQRLSGACRENTTNLVLEFAVLVDEAVKTPVDQFKAGFDLPSDRSPRILQETLALSGGPSGGSWKWEAPAMNIGATVVAPRSPTVPA
jgi:hypothetical protein